MRKKASGSAVLMAESRTTTIDETEKKKQNTIAEG